MMHIKKSNLNTLVDGFDMGAKYDQLIKFSNDLKRLNDLQREQYIESCIKEIAARLLAKVIKRTPSKTGYLRRGWTAGKNQAVNNYVNTLKVRKSGNNYIIDIINPVEYASYVEYGHRTRNGGWVEGRFMLTISEEEIQRDAPRVIENKLKKKLGEIFK